MDITVLPNNNHPEKFLQLDVGMLPATHGMFQIGAALSGQRQWQNRVYSQGDRRGKKEAERPPSPEGRPDFRDSDLEQHITPLTLKPKIKQNPLYVDLRTVDMEEKQRFKPSWTIEDYDRHSLHGNLTNYLQVRNPFDMTQLLDTFTSMNKNRHRHPILNQNLKEDPRKLNFWLEDLYTPGFDSLLKKKEAEHKRNKICRILTSVILSVCVIVIVITVPIVVTQKKG